MEIAIGALPFLPSMSRPLSVLLVEDHDPLRRSLVELLRHRGWRVYETDEGNEALQMARAAQPDLGLLDMHLPGTTGLELFLTIAQEIGPMPTIMMSGDATHKDTEAARAAGVFTFLQKPIEIDHLQRSLDLLIERHFPDSRGQPENPPSRPPGP